MSVVQKACLGASKCSIPVSNDEFGGDPCEDVRKHLDVQVLCTITKWLHIKVSVPVGSRAKVYLPRVSSFASYVPISDWEIAENGQTVWKNGAFVKGVPGVETGAQVGSEAVYFMVESGDYSFELYTNSS